MALSAAQTLTGLVGGPGSDPTKLVKAGSVTFRSAIEALGGTGFNIQVGSRGAVVFMKPIEFLKLAAQKTKFNKESLGAITKQIRQGKEVGPPFLEIEIREFLGHNIPRVVGHEGRHRAEVLRRLQPDVPIPIHFISKSGKAFVKGSADDLTEVLGKIKSGLIRSQEGNLPMVEVTDIFHKGSFF